MNNKKKILFLYTEIAEYFLAGIEALVPLTEEIHIVKWPVNNEAPFSFRELGSVKFYDREKYSDAELLKLSIEINPDIIISSGWIDKAYLKICKTFYGKIPTVLSLDNHWQGSIKQIIAKIISPFYIQTRFSHAWVPGEPQKQYAKKLGFNNKNIFKGFYSADTKLFSSLYEKYIKSKNKKFPKKILYVGRYIHQKGLNNLWESFIELQEENPNEWELICVGTGELFEQRIKHDKIKHLGFKQPSEMSEIIKETGVFILPSNFEPWGVVVHEYAAAGYPLLLSDKVGAGTEFLENNKNGFLFEAENKKSLKTALQKTFSLNGDELINMSKESVKQATKISSNTWANTVVEILKSKN